MTVRHDFIPLILPFLCYDLSVLSYKFKLFSSYGDLNYLDAFPHIQSSLQCGSICARRRQDNGIQPMCEAYNYSTSDRTCRLYAAQMGGTGASAIPVYKYFVSDEDLIDGFDYVTAGGQTYVYHISTDEIPFEKARTTCRSLGGYLAHMDSADEFDIFSKYILDNVGFLNVRLWVGAQDLDNEGVWVTDRDGSPLDFSKWKFSDGEPNDHNSNEDCASYTSWDTFFNDIPCQLNNMYICERTP